MKLPSPVRGHFPRLIALIAGAASATAPASFAQTPASNASPSAPPAEEAIVLSPFHVDASTEKGYLATQTLSGTRLKTDLRDIGAALTIFTEQMLDDLGATNINDILAFAPNTDPFLTRAVDWKIITGFAEGAGDVVDPTQPYYSPATEIFGAWITYQRKLFNNRIAWRLQLNVRNLFDAYTVYPLRTVDRRDGAHTGVTAIYRLTEPRTYTLTSSFKF